MIFRDLLSEFRKSVHKVVSNQLFGNQFCKLSHQGNRRGMVDMLIKLPEIKNLIIEKYYYSKNDTLAENLYKEIVCPDIQVHENQKAIILTKALFVSTYKSKIFLKVLLERSRTWYKLGKFVKCIKDSKYLEDIENISPRDDYYEEIRIESLLIESESYKKMNLEENSKCCLNEAMKKVNDLIQKKFGNENVFKKEKACFLKPIFERLNLMRKLIVENPVTENLNYSLIKVFSFLNFKKI